MRTKFKIKPGDTLHNGHKITEGKIHITGSGKLTYLWVGADKGPCFGYLSGAKTLELLANSILKALKSKEK